MGRVILQLGRALRTDITINGSYDFGIGRPLSNLNDLKMINFRASRILLRVDRDRGTEGAVAALRGPECGVSAACASSFCPVSQRTVAGANRAADGQDGRGVVVLPDGLRPLVTVPARPDQGHPVHPSLRYHLAKLPPQLRRRTLHLALVRLQRLHNSGSTLARAAQCSDHE